MFCFPSKIVEKYDLVTSDVIAMLKASSEEVSTILTSLTNNVWSLCNDQNFDFKELHVRFESCIVSYLKDMREQWSDLRGLNMVKAYQNAIAKYDVDMDLMRQCFYHYNMFVRSIYGKFPSFYNVSNIMKWKWDEVIIMNIYKQLNDAIVELIELTNTNMDRSTGGILYSYVKMTAVDGEPTSVRTRMSLNRERSRLWASRLEARRQYNTEAIDVVVSHFKQSVSQKIEKQYFALLPDFHLWTTQDDSFKTAEKLKNMALFHFQFHFRYTKSFSEASARFGQLMLAYMKNYQNLFKGMFKDQLDRLERVYKLFNDLDGCSAFLQSIFEEYFENEWKALNVVKLDSVSDVKPYICVVLDMRYRFRKLIETHFFNDNKYHYVIDKTLSNVINGTNETQSTSRVLLQLLVRYCHNIITKNANSVFDKVAQDELKKAFKVANFLKDTDAFLDVYGKMLAKRIIKTGLMFENAESFGLTKLIDMHGNEATRLVQRIFAHGKTSHNVTSDYKSYSENNNLATNGIDFSITLFKKRVWPFKLNEATVIPSILKPLYDGFNDFHQSRYSERCLNYLENSWGEIECHIFSRKYCFIANLQQTAVLMMFNDGDDCTLEELMTTTNAKQQSLAALLAPFLKAGIVIVAKGTVFETAPLDTKVRLNMNFASSKSKIDLTRLCNVTPALKPNKSKLV